MINKLIKEKSMYYGNFFEAKNLAISEIGNFLSSLPAKTIFHEKVLSLFEKMNEDEFKQLSESFEKDLAPILKKFKSPVFETKNKPFDETPVSPPEKKTPKLDLNKIKENLKKTKSTPNSDYFSKPIPWTKREKSDLIKLHSETCHIRYRNDSELYRDYIFFIEMVEATKSLRPLFKNHITPKQFVENVKQRKAAHKGRMRADKWETRYSDYGAAALDYMINNPEAKKLKNKNYIQPRFFGSPQLAEIYEKMWFPERNTQFKFNREDIKHGDHELLPENFNPAFFDRTGEKKELFDKQISFYKEVLFECNRIHKANPIYEFKEMVEKAIEQKMLPASFVENYNLHKEDRLKGFTYIEKSKRPLGYVAKP